jgi:predicted patatin/cPLA2 family phospholipase
MRALVISGGGSKGAFAGGFAEHLISDLGIEYDFFVGTSTGSLMVPHLAINKVDKIKSVYTNVSQKDIYNICPFKIKVNPDGTVKSSINHANTARMFLRKKKTFGEHKNLRKTILKSYTREDHELVQQSGKTVVVTVSNLTTRRVESKYARDYNYEDYVDWMWASTSFVPFMSLVEKNGYEYADGGFGNYIPIEEAINLGAKEIDVIVLSPRHQLAENNKTTNAFDLILQSLQFMLYQLGSHDILIGHLESIYNHDVKVNFHFTPRSLTPYSFYFDPKQMKAWWKEGYEYAKLRMNS